ncbi:MAG: hypothetical protein ACYCX7_09565 [Solirubrobacteraceae bacterium]
MASRCWQATLTNPATDGSLASADSLRGLRDRKHGPIVRPKEDSFGSDDTYEDDPVVRHPLPTLDAALQPAAAGSAFVAEAPLVPICSGFLDGILDGERTAVEKEKCPCDNRDMTKAELHELVDRLPDGAVDGAAILLGEISDGYIDPEQAWFWTHEWQTKEREADEDLAAGRVTRYESDKELLAALDERTKPLDADT